MSKVIYLTKGYQTIVDNDDYEELMQFKWNTSQHSDSLVYAKRGVTINNKYFNIYMHRQIMGLTPLSSKKIVVDHIDNNSLNNRKDNLRLVTQKQNMRNPNNKNHRGKKVGVTQCGNKWRTRITINSKSIHLGLFIDEDDAIKARKKAEEFYNKYPDEQALRDYPVHIDDIYYDEKMRKQKGKETRNKILKIIEKLSNEKGYPPSLREIANCASLSVSAVLYHLIRMEQDGLIERDAGIARSIRIVQ